MTARVQSISSGSKAEYGVPAGTLPASSGISPRTRSCRRRTKASARSASALRAEEDRLEDLGGVGEPLEGLQLGVRVRGGADEGERVERPDHQRPLPVEETDRPLGMDPAQDRPSGK